MLILNFEGYFQARITTDPDPTDDKRGLSGYTFALAGEPDFDGKFHFQPDEPGVVEREYGPPGAPGPSVGVTVRSAKRNGEDAKEFVGMKIAFVDAEVIEHNGLLVRDDYFIIDPLRVQLIDGKKVLLDRNDYLNPNDPDMPQWQATSAMLTPRQATMFTANSEEVAQATGLESAANVALIANRLQRKKNLEELLAVTKDPVKRAALESRIEQLDIVQKWWDLSQGTPTNRPIDRRAAQLALQLSGWNIDLDGKIFANRLGAMTDYPWNIQFWMGGWDGDALCGYVKGTWTIPLQLE